MVCTWIWKAAAQYSLMVSSMSLGLVNHSPVCPSVYPSDICISWEKKAPSPITWRSLHVPPHLTFTWSVYMCNCVLFRLSAFSFIA